jgi:hypothetical protein
MTVHAALLDGLGGDTSVVAAVAAYYNHGLGNCEAEDMLDRLVGVDGDLCIHERQLRPVPMTGAVGETRANEDESGHGQPFVTSAQVSVRLPWMHTSPANDVS